jgi:hypothetical protein
LNKSWYSHYQRAVIGVDPLHFSEVDYSSVQNDFNGFHSSPNYANKRAFAVIKDDSSIMAWGAPNYGGTGAPSDSGYTKDSNIATLFA